MKNLSLKILFSFIVLFNLFLLVRNGLDSRFLREESSIQERYKVFYYKTFTERENEHYTLMSQNVYSIDGDSLSLDQLVASKHLILRYSFLSCFACLEKEFEIVFSEINNIPNIRNNIIILVSNASFANILEIKKQMVQVSADIPIYSINTKNFTVPLERSIIPYYFTLDSNLTLQNVFIPMKEFPSWTKDYLQNLDERF